MICAPEFACERCASHWAARQAPNPVWFGDTGRELKDAWRDLDKSALDQYTSMILSAAAVAYTLVRFMTV